MRSRHPLLAAVAAFGMLAGCGTTTPTEPRADGPLTLTARITSTTIRPGEPAVATFLVTNVTGRTVTVGFPSSCQVLPYVRERHTKTLVHPAGGGWGCLTVITSLTLDPGQSRGWDVHILSASAPNSAALASVADLPTGDYAAHAEMDGAIDGAPISLRSGALQFSIQ